MKYGLPKTRRKLCLAISIFKGQAAAFYCGYVRNRQAYGVLF
jgi:hypothetical protein